METLTMTVQKIFPTQIEPGSIADQLLKKGREEGREEGCEEGEIKGEIKLIQTLQAILGVPVSDVTALQGQSLEQLRTIAEDLRNKIQRRS
jgi:predicted transposase YdaD